MVDVVHPIEHLRFVARAQGADPTMLALETAQALAHMAFDSSGLVVSCRRVVERHPTVGTLWWLCSHLLVTTDPTVRARELASELYDDATADRMVAEIPDSSTVMVTGMPSTIADALCRRGDVRVVVVGDDRNSDALVHRLVRAQVDVESISLAASAAYASRIDAVLLEVDATSASQSITELGGGVLAAVATAARRPLWLVAGRGRRLPADYLTAMIERSDEDEELDVDVLDVMSASLVFGPDTAGAPSAATLAPECPLAAELVRRHR